VRAGEHHSKGFVMLIQSYLFHLRARNLSPHTIKTAGEFISQFLTAHDPLSSTKRDIQGFLALKSESCKPSTVQTYWRFLKSFFQWLTEEGDIAINPMVGISKPIVPPTEIKVLTATEVQRLLATCRGRNPEDRRDLAILTIMLDAGLRLSELTNLKLDDVGADQTLRVFGKGRKWRTVALGSTSSTALERWIRPRGNAPGSLWVGRKGDLTATGIRQVIRRRAKLADLHVHPHMLRHTFVDNWLRHGGSEVDLARLAGWTSTAMASRYAQFRAAERAISSHGRVAPLDSISKSLK